MDFQMIKRDDPFDRKLFHPEKHRVHKMILNILRQSGRKRLHDYQRALESGRSVTDCASRSLKLVLPYRSVTPGRYVDFACGDSADALIAQRHGFESFALDLFPSYTTNLLGSAFIIADIAEPLPFKPNSVDIATCHAAIDLIEPRVRQLFYLRVFQILKPGGRFSITFQRLKNGHGFELWRERRNINFAGFRYEGQICKGITTIGVKQ